MFHRSQSGKTIYDNSAFICVKTLITLIHSFFKSASAVVVFLKHTVYETLLKMKDLNEFRHLFFVYVSFVNRMFSRFGTDCLAPTRQMVASSRQQLVEEK